MVNIRCVVPMCNNSRKKTPNKLFFSVPHDPKVRKKWMEIIKKADPISAKSLLHCCEDHFDLPNDMDNYMRYHLLGSVQRGLLKPNCLPSKFACQPDRKKRTTSTPRAAFLKRQRKHIIEQLLQDDRETRKDIVEQVLQDEKETRKDMGEQLLQDEKETRKYMGEQLLQDEKETRKDMGEQLLQDEKETKKTTKVYKHLSRKPSTDLRSKVTHAQIDVLCTFFEENPEVIKGYKKTTVNRRKVQDKWIQITPHLNSLGAARDHKAWAKYLNDLKTRLKKQRIEWKETSDGPVICVAEDYSELKLRMLQVLKEDQPNAQDESNTTQEENSIDFIEDNSNYEEQCEDVCVYDYGMVNPLKEQKATTNSDNSLSSERQSSHIFSNDNGYGDEFDWFGKNVAQQLRTLPIEVALETQELVLSVIRKKRLEVLNNSNHCDPLESKDWLSKV